MLKHWWNLAAVRRAPSPAPSAPDPADLDLSDDELETVVGGLNRALHPALPERAPGAA
jgi:hypothetical protein